MRRHHTGQRGVEPVVGRGVIGQDGLEAALIDRDVGVRVGLDEAVARKMFAAVGHAALQQAVHQAFSEQGNHAWVAAKGTVADDAAFAIVQVQHRGKAEVNTAGAQLGAQNIAAGGSRIGGAELVCYPQLA